MKVLKMKRAGIYVVLIVTMVIAMRAAGDPKVGTSCLSELKITMQTERKAIKDALAASQGWHMKYSSVTEVLNGTTNKYESIVSKGEIIAGSKMRYSKTDNAEVYVDAHDIFSVNKRTNTITHTFTNKSDLAVPTDVFSSSLQDSLLKLMRLTDCKTVKVHDKDAICYNLVSDDPKCPYTSLSIYAEPGTYRLCKMHALMNLTRQKQVKEFTMDVPERNTIKVGSEWSNIATRFLDKSGHLVSPYEKYHLVEPDKVKAAQPKNELKPHVKKSAKKK